MCKRIHAFLNPYILELSLPDQDKKLFPRNWLLSDIINSGLSFAAKYIQDTPVMTIGLKLWSLKCTLGFFMI